jgi:hypothetical protein
LAGFSYRATLNTGPDAGCRAPHQPDRTLGLGHSHVALQLRGGGWGFLALGAGRSSLGTGQRSVVIDAYASQGTDLLRGSPQPMLWSTKPSRLPSTSPCIAATGVCPLRSEAKILRLGN